MQSTIQSHAQINNLPFPSPNSILELIFSDITFAVLAATESLSASLSGIIQDLKAQFEDLANFLNNLVTDFLSGMEDWISFLDRHKTAIDLLRFDFSE
jgi:hypothetical protein